MSSPRFGLSVPYRLTTVGDLHLGLHFDNGATSKNDDVLDENVGLLCVLPLAVHLTFFY